jgi:hypothetical protein
VDSAVARMSNPFLIKSRNPPPDMTLDEIEVAKDTTSMHQSSVCYAGISGFISSYQRSHYH